jgi:NAD(P)H-hydrate epimerase
MTAPSSFVYAAGDVRLLDRIAIDELGIPGYELMGRAGRAAFELARGRYPDARRWLVLCGAGNNAGDGYVVAKLALEAGLAPMVATLADPRRLAGDAATAFRDFECAGGTVLPFTGVIDGAVGLVVDALLGTGLARPLEGEWLRAVEAVNASGRPVIALDVPSGLDADTGRPRGAAVRADVTVTFIGRKLGLYLAGGPDYAGDVCLADLGLPLERMARVAPRLRIVDASDHARALPRRARTAHKGAFGHVLVIGGNHGMGGAGRLAGEAALRAGAGLVSVATRAENAQAAVSARPELMCHAVDGPAGLEPLLERATVIAIGPGLGRDAWAQGLLARVLAAPRPLVLDADALNLLAARPQRRDDWVLTPHPGEAARLLGRSSGAVQADRSGAVAELCARYGGIALLKGRGTLVARAGELPYLVDAGNPGMATGGMGDVLTGLLAGLLAQSAPADRLLAAACAADLHARAADAAARDGERGLVASDLFAPLRRWLNPAA